MSKLEEPFIAYRNGVFSIVRLENINDSNWKYIALESDIKSQAEAEQKLENILNADNTK